MQNLFAVLTHSEIIEYISKMTPASQRKLILQPGMLVIVPTFPQIHFLVILLSDTMYFQRAYTFS